MERRWIFFLAGLFILLGLLTRVTDRWVETASWRTVAIPRQEHGYSNFQTSVITSAAELDDFMRREAGAEKMGWNDRKGFNAAINNARINFDREALVLLRHDEGSGSARVTFQQPRLKGKKLLCRIDSKQPEVGTADMAYYCFALAVLRSDIDQVSLQEPGGRETLLPLAK